MCEIVEDRLITGFGNVMGKLFFFVASGVLLIDTEVSFTVHKLNGFIIESEFMYQKTFQQKFYLTENSSLSDASYVKTER